MTRFGCVGFSMYACGFSVLQMRQFCLFTYAPRSKWASSEKIASCYTAEATLDVLCPVFEHRIISRRADVVWPPRSWDLTLLDYYLWGAVKDKCYADKPEGIDALKDNIREAIGEKQRHTIDNVLKMWTNCVGYCVASRGSHLNEIIFNY